MSAGFDPSRDDTDELLADLAQAALEHDGDLITGNLFQLAHATIAAQAAEIRRLLLVNGQLALEWATQKDCDDAIASLRETALTHAIMARELGEDPSITTARAAYFEDYLASAISGCAQDRETGLGPKGASAVAKRDAQ